MKIYRVSFVGHRMLQNIGSLETQLENLIRELLLQNEYVEFFIGRNGDFDILVASVIKRVQKTVGKENSSLILALPYHAKDEKYYENYYDEVCFPIEEKIHFKAAILRRNQWMIDQSDLLVAYVEHKTGGAFKALKYAEKKAIKIIRLGAEH